MNRWNAMVASIALATLAPFALAQSDPNLIGVGDWSGPLEIRFPTALIEGAPITILVPSDGCFQSGPRIVPAATTIVREGNNVSVDFYANMMVCFSAGDPPGVWNHHQAIGAFAAGTYAITARYHYVESPGAAPFAILASSMNVARGGPAPTGLPTLSASILFLSGLMLGIIGLIGIRQRRLRNRV